MSIDINRQTEQSFRSSAAAGIAVVTLVVGAPFGIANLFQGHYAVAASSLGMTALLCAHAASVRWRPHLAIVTSLLIAPGGILFLVIAVQERGALGLFWAFPAVLGFYCLLTERLAWVANLALIAILYPVAYANVEFAYVLRASATLLAVSLFSAVLIRVIRDHQHALVKRIKTDALTGVLNRESLPAVLSQAVQRPNTDGKRAALIALDVDNFKHINDRQGHAAGDRVLKQLGTSLEKHSGINDIVFRTGGDEFLVLLPSTLDTDWYQRSETLRTSAQQEMVLSSQPVTLCAGIAELQADQTVDEWLAAADSALYAAKAAGRNRTIVSTAAAQRHPETATAPPIGA